MSIKNSLPNSAKSVFLILLATFVACALAFYCSFEKVQENLKILSHLASYHLLYVLETKDDLELIDWPKDFEKTPGVVAFRVLDSEKTIASGGNIQDLSSPTKPGLSFLFPFHWSFCLDWGDNSVEPKSFQILYNTYPDPLVNAFIVLVTGFLSVFFSLLFRPHSANISITSTTNNGAPQSITIAKTNPQISPLGQHSLVFLNEQWVITDASNTEKNLKVSRDELLQKHFLLLQPSQELAKALEHKLEQTVLPGFISPHLKHLTATVKPVPNGMLVIIDEKKPETA